MSRILYGHRGAAGEAPENTLKGFAYARRIGVRALELDVRLSADDQLVVIHDATLERTMNAAGNVSGLSAAQLKALQALGSSSTPLDSVGVPMLGDVLLAHCDLDAFQLEIKSDTPRALRQICEQLTTLIDHFRISERTIVTSFDSLALDIIRRRAPQLRRGFIATYEKQESLDIALELKCWNACIPLASSSNEMVVAAQAKGLHVTGWLGNTPSDLAKLIEWNVDSITSDYPSTALPFLRECGFLE